MRKKSYFYTVLLFAAACTACARSEPEPAPDLPEGQSACGLTVDEARTFFDNQAQQSTRTAGDDRMLSAFPVSEVVPDWSDSRPSQNERLACVDVPAETGSVFRILRRQPDGTMYAPMENYWSPSRCKPTRWRFTCAMSCPTDSMPMPTTAI